MKKVYLAAIVFTLLFFTAVLSAQARQTASATVNGKKISIDYGRPALRGRNLLGQARTGTVWRLGMNEATEITSEAALMVGGKHLNPGKYSLWATKKGETTWELAFHPETGIWGQPEMRSGYVGTVPLRVETDSQHAENLNITLTAMGKDLNIEIHWGTSRLVGVFQTM